MRRQSATGQFKRDVRRAERRGKDLRKLRAAVELLLAAAPLPPALRDHSLRGQWQGFRDLHIEPDWLLIYRLDGDEVILTRTGTHADLFDE